MKYISLMRFKNVLLYSDNSPRLTAISMAIGVGLAFSPFPGAHFLIAFTLSRIFKLNGVVLLSGVLIHNPWTMIPIHSVGLVIGDLVLSGSLQSLDTFKLLPWHDLGLFTLLSGSFFRENGTLLLEILKPFVVGHLILSGTMGTLTYRFVSRFIANKRGLNEPMP